MSIADGKSDLENIKINLKNYDISIKDYETQLKNYGEDPEDLIKEREEKEEELNDLIGDIKDKMPPLATALPIIFLFMISPDAIIIKPFVAGARTTFLPILILACLIVIVSPIDVPAFDRVRPSILTISSPISAGYA